MRRLRIRAASLAFGCAVSLAHAQEPPSLAGAVSAYAKSKGARATPEFRHALIDLSGDRKSDAIVLLGGPDWCGSGGCTMLVLKADAFGYSPVSSSTVTRAPIRVSSEKRKGWRTLIVDTKGRGDVVLRFDGKAYPGNPSVQPKATAKQLKAARTILE
jgi:hypothetical protein